MELSITKEVWIFLLSLPLGVAIAIVYDFFRVFRLIFRSGKVAIFFQDVLFWLITALSVFLFFFLTNSGEIRGYGIFGTLLASMLYFFTISKFLIKHLTKLIKAIKVKIRQFFAPIGIFLGKTKIKLKNSAKKAIKTNIISKKLFKIKKKKSKMNRRGNKPAEVRTTIHC